jgi:hypothetical protein
MRTIRTSNLHRENTSYAMALVEHNYRQFKIVHEFYNANETCNAYLLTDKGWEKVFNLSDLEETPRVDAYNVLDKSMRYVCANQRIDKMKYLVKDLRVV